METVPKPPRLGDGSLDLESSDGPVPALFCSASCNIDPEVTSPCPIQEIKIRWGVQYHGDRRWPIDWILLFQLLLRLSDVRTLWLWGQSLHNVRGGYQELCSHPIPLLWGGKPWLTYSRPRCVVLKFPGFSLKFLSTFPPERWSWRTWLLPSCHILGGLRSEGNFERENLAPGFKS